MGWRVDLEEPGSARRNELFAMATPFELPMMGNPPIEIDPRPFNKVENQLQQGACEGHDISSCFEHCYHIATGEVKQFSRAHGYYGTQRIDGIRGDNGATIAGGVRLVTEVGLVSDEVWPYPRNYNPTPPVSWDEIAKLAAPFKIRSHSVLNGIDDVFNYLATGTGAVTIGTSWGFTPDANGVVERYRRSNGGHATAVLGYSKRKDSAGRNYFWLLNSWGETWGNKGWGEISPQAMSDALSDQYAVAIGISDLSTPVVRPISWVESPVI